MGCDIHCYVEYQDPDDSESRPSHWRDFGGRINPGRNYHVFGRLAGMRSGSALVEPRGVPDDMAWEADGDWWMWIDYSGTDIADDNVSEANANKYASYGSRLRGEKSIWTRVVVNSDGTKSTSLVDAEHDGKPTHVEHPDWHTPTWLTPDEFAAAIADGAPVEYRAILAAMKSLEADGNKVRVVMWFDN